MFYPVSVLPDYLSAVAEMGLIMTIWRLSFKNTVNPFKKSFYSNILFCKMFCVTFWNKNYKNKIGRLEQKIREAIASHFEV